MTRWILGLTTIALVGLLLWWTSASQPTPPETVFKAENTPSVRRTEEPLFATASPAVQRTFGATIKGKILRHGRGQEHAIVQVKGPTNLKLESSDGGVYEFTNLEIGDYLVWASWKGESSSVVGPLRVDSLSQVDLELKPSAALEGTVIDAQSREAIGKAVVSSTTGTTSTDHAGRFKLGGLPSGETWIEASAPGYLKRIEWLGIPGAKVHSGLQLALLPSARLEGVVQYPGGKPVAAASVWAETGVSERAGQTCGPVQTRLDGTFALDCAEGPLLLAARAPGGARVEGPRLRAEAGTTRKGLQIQLGEELSVRGVVTSAGKPVPQAIVVLIDARSQLIATGGTMTDAAGAFQSSSVPVGRYLVQVSRGHRNVQVGPFEQTGEGQEWNVELPDGKRLWGHVEPRQAGVQVTWRSSDWAGSPNVAMTDAQGTFDFEGVGSGVLFVEAESSSGVASVRTQAGSEVVLKLDRPLLTVVALDDKNVPITDYLLIADPLGVGTAKRIPVLSTDGTFEGLIGVGKWRVIATATGYEASEPQEVQLDRPQSIRLVLKNAAVLRAVVFDAKSLAPVSGAEVTFKTFVPGRWYAPSRQLGPYVSDGRGEIRAVVAEPAVVTAKRGKKVMTLPTNRLRRDSSGRLEIPLPAEDNAAANTPEVTEYEGIGAQLGNDGPKVVVWAVFEGSPAEAAGIQRGDVVLAVDGQPARAPAEQVIPRILGPSGTLVSLTLQRSAETLDVAVRRRAIRY